MNKMFLKSLCLALVYSLQGGSGHYFLTLLVFLSEMLTIVAATYALTVGLSTDDNVNVLYIF